MAPPPSDRLRSIKRLDQLVAYLRDELDWPIEGDDITDITYEYDANEVGLDEEHAAKIRDIKQLRPLTSSQPWGIFWVSFEKKRLPVVVMRRILANLVVKSRAGANSADRRRWNLHDLLFISSFGEGEDQREIAFAHFHQEDGDLPTLRVLGWDGGDTVLELQHVAHTLSNKLRWPQDPAGVDQWRQQWSGAFRHRIGHVIRTADTLAEVLAALAKRIRDAAERLIAAESERGPLTKLYRAFQAALIHDLTEEQFADTYAQTITYGLLTAAISRTDMSESRMGTVLVAENVTDMVPVTNPFLKEMLQTFLKAGGRRGGIDFDELGIQDVVDLLRGDETDLPAILRNFGDRKPGEDPVIHFYEHFLSAYNKQLKIQRGVFYTPQPVVSYIVRSVHELLQTEFGLTDGLADTTTWGDMLKTHPSLKLPTLTDEPGERRTISPDEPFVQILDPATGTATFLVEVIDTIHRTLTAKWKRQRLTEAQQTAEWNRYVPKHLLPRLHAFELMMAPYAIAHMKIGLKLHETGYRFGTEERARIYLTNALEPKVKQLPQIGFDALAHEAAAVNEIKWYKRFTVVIGNPPYAGHSSNNDVRWIVDRVHDYTKDFADLQKPGQGKWLQDDYVKFYRFSVHLIASTGRGAMGLITNNGFLDNATFRGMRKHTTETLPILSLLDLRGSVMKREKTEEGSQDENVFDIQQSVAVTIGALSPLGNGRVSHLEIVGSRVHKYHWLAEHASASSGSKIIRPQPPFYLLVPSNETISKEYFRFPGIHQILNQNGDPAPGIVTTHDEFAISWTKEEQMEKVQKLLATKSEQEARKVFRLCTQSQWSYNRAKQELPSSGWRDKLVQVLYRPFDLRWTVFDSNVAVHRRERVTSHVLKQRNLALIFMRQVALDDEYSHFGVSRFIVDNRAFYSNKGIMFLAPLYLARVSRGDLLDNAEEASRTNLDPQAFRSIAKGIGLTSTEEPSGDLKATLGPEDIFHYAYAVFHSPGYRSRYAEFLKIDFPRLPLTGNLEMFRGLAQLGGELTALHLLESPVLEKRRTEWVGGRNSEVGKVSWAKNTVWVDKDQTAGFKGVREEVWNFHIGGYQVCEKWLKDRKGRTLSKDDIDHYHKIVVALSETIRLMAEIDQVIAKHGGWPGAFAQFGGEVVLMPLPAEESSMRVAEDQAPYGTPKPDLGLQPEDELPLG